jgi:hypothetical protein
MSTILHLELDNETNHLSINTNTADKDQIGGLLAMAMKNNKDFKFMVIKALMFVQKDEKEAIKEKEDGEQELEILN